jgi:hypothetical protein
MQRQTPVNIDIVESRMKKPFSEYIQACIEQLERFNDKGILQGMGELMDNKMKKFVLVEMRSEVLKLLKFYKDYPILPDDEVS